MSVKRLVIASAALALSVASAAAQTKQSPFVMDASIKPGASGEAWLPSSAPRGGEPGLKLNRQMPAAPAKSAAGPKPVDETALRFYASQADTARVAAEIRRIKTLNPTWQPPEDLFVAATTNVDEQPLWELFGQGKFADVHDQIERIRAETPDYQPSAELAKKLSLADRRTAIVAASDSKDAETVVSLATDTPALLVCAEMDVLWRVAEAFAALDEADRALDVYRYILTNCEDSKERLATIQKASFVVSSHSVEPLLQLGRRRANGTSEFDNVRLDLIRRMIGDVASGKSADAPSERDIKQIEASAKRRNGADASLLGWYAYQRKDYDAALSWFKLAADVSRDPKNIEGIVLTMRNMNQIPQAENFAYDNRDASPLIRKAFIEIVAGQITAPKAEPFPADRLQRGIEVVTAEKSALGAQSVGWYLFNQGDIRNARSWFDNAVAWGPSEEGVLGLAVSLERLGDRKGSIALLEKYRSQYPAVAALETAQKARAVADGRSKSGRKVAKGGGMSKEQKDSIALFEAGKYREAADLLDRNEKRMDRGMKELRAWAHFKAADYDTAVKAFADINKSQPTGSSQHGQFLADVYNKGISKYIFN